MKNNGDIVVTAGKSLTKIKLTNGTYFVDNTVGEVLYDSYFFTISKNGKVTTKANHYGVSVLYIDNSCYVIYITDGSKKMYKALDKWETSNITSGQLTVGSDGKYTIKRIVGK